MKNQFIKMTFIEKGHEFDVIVNKNDIARLSYGFNKLECKTPFPNGRRYSISLSQKEFDRVEKILLER